MHRTATDYLASLNDGRSVFVNDVELDDVSTHPVTRGCARTVAALVALPNEVRELSHIGEGDARPSHYAYVLPRTPSQLAAKGLAFQLVAERTGGLMARTPDFLAALVTSWQASNSAFGELAPNVRDLYSRSKAGSLCHSHAISDPPDSRYFEQNGTLRKVKNRPDGIVVRGTKMLATLAPFCDELLVYPYRPTPPDQPERALAFSIPAATPGLKFLCRNGLSQLDTDTKPTLSHRFDEMDCLCVFDDVFIPAANVLIDGDCGLANELRVRTNMVEFLWQQCAHRVAVEAEMLAGLGIELAERSGRSGKIEVRAFLGEMIAQADALRALVGAAEASCHVDQGGVYYCDRGFLASATSLAFDFYERAISFIRKIGASDLIIAFNQQSFAAAHNEARGREVDDRSEYFQLLGLANELAVRTFGGRQMLYEEFYLGPQIVLKSTRYEQANREKLTRLARSLAG